MITYSLKNFFHQHPVYHTSELIQKLNQYPMVSFDIFDTLVKRNVSTPTEVFRIVGKCYKQEIQTNWSAEEFQNARIQAERTARAQAETRGSEEITLQEIYDCLSKPYRDAGSRLLELEVEVELSCCHANPVMKRVYDWCRENGKKILIVSDMYLPLNAVEEILRRCGYEGYDRLYLSSVEGVTKGSGNLFALVLKTAGIGANDVIHIGDSPRADYLGAKKQKIAAIHIARNPKRTKFTRLTKVPKKHKAEMERLAAIMNGYIDPEWDIYYQYGFEVLGPLLDGFVTWLHEDAKKRGIKKLFFLSRDGYLMRRAYQVAFGENSLENTYFYASRRAFHTPRIWLYPDLKDILSLYSENKIWSFNTLCEELGVDSQEVAEIWESLGLRTDILFRTKELLDHQEIYAFFAQLKNKIIENSKCEFSILVDYLNQNHFNGNVAIIDIGWGGSMQICLTEILSHTSIQANVYGYYVGLDLDSPLVDASAYIAKKELPRQFCSGIFEFPYLAFEGSARTYKKNEDGVIHPVLYPFEYADKQRERNIAHLIQTGALYFVRNMQCMAEFSEVDNAVMYENMRLSTKEPRLLETNLLGDILFFDGESHGLAVPKSLCYYATNFKECKRDFAESQWKIGFIKRLLKLPLPYYSVLLGTKKLRNMVYRKKG